LQKIKSRLQQTTALYTELQKAKFRLQQTTVLYTELQKAKFRLQQTTVLYTELEKTNFRLQQTTHIQLKRKTPVIATGVSPLSFQLFTYWNDSTFVFF